MFGYEPCSVCKLYHLSQDLEAQVCSSCEPRPKEKTCVPLSKPQYERLFERRLEAIRYFLRPTQPCYPSDFYKG